MIRKNAENPNAAKLWVDYMLSPRGQRQLQVADIYPIRDDVTNIEPGVVVLRQLPDVARPAVLKPALAQLADPNKDIEFEKRLESRWHTNIVGPKSLMGGSASSGTTVSRAQRPAVVAREGGN
jgi:ABC-type Fe3+ transport system substrate-binding protein